MYSHPQVHSYLQSIAGPISSKTLNRMVDKARLRQTDCYSAHRSFQRLESSQPQCFAPEVDITRAQCAFGNWALPKLRRELLDKDPLIVRQAVTTMCDMFVDPEKLYEAVELKIPDRLSDLLLSEDSYVRERVAMIYKSFANQTIGRDEILNNCKTVSNLAQGLKDRLAAVRIKIAEVMEMLAFSWTAAERLCAYGFVDLIAEHIDEEKKHIISTHLETLHSLLAHDVKITALEKGLFEKFVNLLQRKDEKVLCGALSCLSALCKELKGKEKALELDLLSTLRDFLFDDRPSVKTKAAELLAFVTITTPGKLQASKMQIINVLLTLAADFHHWDLQLAAMKVLTNIAETPEGRKIMLNGHTMFIEDIDICEQVDLVDEHRQILLDVIRWTP